MEPKMIINFIGKKSRTTRHHLLPIYLVFVQKPYNSMGTSIRRL